MDKKEENIIQKKQQEKYFYPNTVNILKTMKKEMKQQLVIYDAMEKEALKLGARMGYQLKDLNPGIIRMSEAMARMRLIGGQRDSKIAGMLIQGNTRGVILGSKNLHHGQSEPS